MIQGGTNMSTLAKAADHAAPDLKNPKLFRQQCYIDGAWLDAESGKGIEVTNPATGEVLGTVPNMGTAGTRRAIEASNRALATWRDENAKERYHIMRRRYDLV